MRYEHVLRYDAPPADVHAMLADPAFREAVCAAQQVNSSTVSVEGTGDAMTVVVEQRRPSEGIPSFAKKIVGDEIHVVQRETWTDSSGGEFEVTIPGKPGQLAGRVTLAPDGAGTVETVAGDLTVKIPLVGGKLESLIAEMLDVALQTEQRVGRDWLTGRR